MSNAAQRRIERCYESGHWPRRQRHTISVVLAALLAVMVGCWVMALLTAYGVIK